MIFGKTASADLNDWGPFLQTLTPNSVIVKWRVPASEDFNNSIHFGTSPGSLTTIETDTTAVTKSCGYCPESWREYEVTLTSLTADTRYYYAVGTSTTPSTESKHNGTFLTPPNAGTAKPTRIWVVGDSGTGDTRALVVGERFKNYTKDRDPDIWLMLGDNAYDDGNDRNHHDGVFLMYPEFLRNVSVWPTFGNHDARSATSGNETGTYFDIWQLPRAAEAGGVASGTEAYYSFDYGNIHFIVLDSFGHPRVAPSSMITWLQSDLAANDKEWIIAYWHHPPYTRGSHNSNAEQILIEMRENIVPILESNGVDLVLSGHSHSYERSYFLNGHYGDQTTFNLGTHALDSGNGKSEPLHMSDGAYSKTLNPNGTKAGNDGAVYAVAGSSGKISGGLLNHPAMYLSLNKLGSMVLDVYENRLEAIFIDSLGKIEDQFTITHDLNTFPPELFSVYAPNPLTLEVQFSEPLEKVSAENAGNYVLDNGATITAAELLDDYRTVRLLTSELSNTTTYNLTVTNVQDHESNTAIPAPGSQFSFTPSFVDPPVYSAHFQDGTYPHSGYNGTRDTYIFEGAPDTNYGTKAELIAHGPFENTIEGDALVLVSWDLSSIPSNATIQSATVYFDLYNRSETSYHLHQILTTWTEIGATWNSLGGTTNVSGTIMGTITPQKFAMNTIPLNAAGISVVQGWVDGTITNNGLAVQNGGPGEHTKWWNAIRFFSRQTDTRPRLSVTYTLPTGADSIAPSIIAPPDVVVDSTGDQTSVTLGSAVAVDDNGSPTVTNDAPAGGFPLGMTIVTWTATDAAGNTGTDTQKVTVKVPESLLTHTISFQNGVEPSAFYFGTEDSSLRESSPHKNEGNDTELWGDGNAPDPETGQYGEVTFVTKWDVSAIPSDAVVTAVDVSYNVFNDSPVNHNIYAVEADWTEPEVTWEIISHSTTVGNTILGAIPPFTFNENIVTLNQAGIDLVQGWINGTIPNYGFYIQSSGSNNGMGVHSSEATTATTRPKITISYVIPNGADVIPPVVTAPPDITTTDTTPDIGTGTAIDNVDGPLTPTNDSPGTFPLGTTIVTWSATDAAGNTGTDTQSVTVQEAPGGPVTVSFQEGVLPDAGYAGTQDSLLRQTSPDQNFGTDVQLLSDAVAPDPSNGLFGEVMSVVSWDLTSVPNTAVVSSASITMDFFDASSGPYNFLQALTPWNEGTVTWNSFGGGSANVGTDIIATIPGFSFNETEVNLTAEGLSLVQGWIDGSIANNGLVLKTGGSNNGVGANSSEATTNRPKITITYSIPTGGDTEPPVVTAPADIVTVSTGDLTPVSLGTGTANDNVDGPLVPTNDAPAGGFPVGTTVVTWSATDSSGNTGTDTQNVTVQIPVSGGVEAVSFQEGVEPNPAYVGVQDSYLRQTSPDQNVGTDVQLLSDAVAPDPSNGLFGEVMTVVNWDVSGIPTNATVQSVSITMDFFDASSGPYNFLQALTPWNEGTVTWNSFGGGSANVGTDIIATIPGFSFDETEVNLTAQGISLVQGWIDGSIPNNGLVLKTSGTNNGVGANSSEATTNRPKLNITFSTPSGGGDTIPPVVTAPADITTTDTTPNLGTGTAVDNVDGTLVPTNNAPAVFPLGTTIVTWSATDSSGNTGTDNQSVTITDPTSTDTTPPVVTAPADITTEATGPTTSVSLGTGTANDNVDGPITPTNDAPSGGFPVGTTIVTWSATDTAGNTGTDTQSVTITDTTAPTVTAPADITTTDTTPNLGAGTASDLVDGSITPTNNAPGTFPIGTTIVTWSATDTAGNTGTDTQSVTVQSGGSTTVNLTSSNDTFIREYQPFDVNGLMTTLEVDADQLNPPSGFNDEIFAVLAWNVSSIPSTANVQSVTITFNVTNTSSGTYELFQTLTAWSETTANWYTFLPLSTSLGSSVLGTFNPTAGSNVITLNASGINLVQGWINGSITNNGIAVRSGGTTDNTIFNSKEAASNKPQISITYN